MGKFFWRCIYDDPQKSDEGSSSDFRVSCCARSLGNGPGRAETGQDHGDESAQGGHPRRLPPLFHAGQGMGRYEGHDVELAELLASELGVAVEFVPTTWPKLMEDYLAGSFDIAVGGITRSLARMLKGDFLPPYAPNGKVAIIRKADREKFSSLEAMDVPETTVIVNPGGTNEKFVQANFKTPKSWFTRATPKYPP